MVGDRLPYTQADVEMMLRVSAEINYKRDDIRRFLALLSGSQPEHAEPWDLFIDFTDPVDGIRVTLSVSFVHSLHVVGHVNSVPLVLWHVNEGYKPPKPVFVGAIWRSLPTLMNVAGNENPAFRDYVKFLRQIDDRTQAARA